MPLGISGNTIVGYYNNGSLTHGFKLVGNKCTTIDFPGAFVTAIAGISGNTLVGWYFDMNDVQHGFIDANGAFSTLDDPNATEGTFLSAISNNMAVGAYTDALGDQAFVATPVPEPFYINGSKIGTFTDSGQIIHYFKYGVYATESVATRAGIYYKNAKYSKRI